MTSLFYRKSALIDPAMKSSYSSLVCAGKLDVNQLACLNWERRKKIVAYCAENIPFYQEKFKSIGFEIGDLKSEEDFNKLPILEKEDIRERAPDIVSPDFDISSLPASTTGGTTGQPLKTYNDPRVHLSSMSWRMLEWWGVSAADNSAYLYRSIPTGLRKILSDIALWPTKRAYLSATDMTMRQMEKFYTRLIRIRPKYLVGYVGSIDEFAKFLEINELKIPNLNAVWTTSAPLTNGKRIQYENIFSCPVYTQYGSCEFYWIAAECDRKCGLHIGADIRHVDVVENGNCVPQGHFGDLVITDLVNYAFPLLRYRIGDRGRLLKKQCECGLPFPLMDYVKGRISDSIYFRDGTSIPGEFWTTIFDDFTDVICAFQVKQRADYSLVILYEVFEGTDAIDAINIVERRLKVKIRGRIPLRFERGEISGNDNGKLRFVVSELRR